MNTNRKKLFLFFGGLLLAFLAAFSYFNWNPELEANNLRIANVSNIQDDRQLDDLPSLLNLRVLSYTKKMLIAKNDALIPYADLNIISFSDRETFIQKNNFSGSSLADDSEFSLISDPSYQLLAIPKYSSSEQGQLYLRLDQSYTKVTPSVDVDGSIYSAKGVQGDWFVIENLPVYQNKIIALKTDSTITAAYLFVSQEQSQRASAGQVRIRQSKFWSSFNLSMPDDSFALITLSEEYQVVGSRVNTLHDQQTHIVCANGTLSDSTLLPCAAQGESAYIIKKSARYYLNSATPSLVSMFITLVILLVLLFVVLGRYSVSGIVERLQKIGNQIERNHLWVILYLFWIDVLIILEIIPPIPILSSRKFLVVMAVLPLIVYKKYSPRLFSLIAVIILSAGLLLGLGGFRSDGIFVLVFVFIFLILLSLSIKELLKRAEKSD